MVAGVRLPVALGPGRRKIFDRFTVEYRMRRSCGLVHYEVISRRKEVGGLE